MDPSFSEDGEVALELGVKQPELGVEDEEDEEELKGFIRDDN